MAQTSGKRNSIINSGMTAAQTAQKLFSYLQQHEFDKFRLVIDTLSSDKQREKDLNFILNEWTDDKTGHYLLTFAADTNNCEIAKFLLDHKVCIHVHTHALLLD